MAPGWEDGNEPSVSARSGGSGCLDQDPDPLSQPEPHSPPEPGSLKVSLVKPHLPCYSEALAGRFLQGQQSLSPHPWPGCRFAGLFCFFGSVRTRPLPVYLIV